MATGGGANDSIIQIVGGALLLVASAMLSKLIDLVSKVLKERQKERDDLIKKAAVSETRLEYEMKHRINNRIQTGIELGHKTDNLEALIKKAVQDVIEEKNAHENV